MRACVHAAWAWRQKEEGQGRRTRNERTSMCALTTRGSPSPASSCSAATTVAQKPLRRQNKAGGAGVKLTPQDGRVLCVAGRRRARAPAGPAAPRCSTAPTANRQPPQHVRATRRQPLANVAHTAQREDGEGRPTGAHAVPHTPTHAWFVPPGRPPPCSPAPPPPSRPGTTQTQTRRNPPARGTRILARPAPSSAHRRRCTAARPSGRHRAACTWQSRGSPPRTLRCRP